MGSLANASGQRFSGVPTYSPDQADWLRQIAVVVNSLLQGRILSTGSVTLTANSATTTLSDPRIGPNSHISFTPTTANGAGALSGLYVSARTAGSATLTHANNAQTDKSFTYSVLG